ncbi:hypothetical protein GCM10017783_10420 [Deinococcus piscis]|uniref:Uncharacterized protein n=1 Tax=Deinococcus piscis TaxID=394230 RepID=A0ABQ3K4T1_9DEIO|nr:hypothetical protein GCM10017783_10420 [Deinococcus piscis]
MGSAAPAPLHAHTYAFAAPDSLPDEWQHHADGHLFSFHWADLADPKLDWEMDAALPHLLRHLDPQTLRPPKEHP